MFIKKDTRKIPQILADATARLSPESPEEGNPITELSFSRRAPELSTGISIILKPSYYPALENLLQLSLYDCGLKSLREIESGSVLFPKLEQLDVGRNPFLVNDSLSSKFHAQFPSLKELWADNCAFGPDIPETLLQLNKLEVVRMTGNKLQFVKEIDKYWPLVKVLALDGNDIVSVAGIGKLQQLEKLHLRQNKLIELEGLPYKKLTMISLSSNQLTKFPDSLVNATALRELYLNGNQIAVLPNGLANLGQLNKLNLAHNKIGQDVSDEGNILPEDFVQRFGMPDVMSGCCSVDKTCVVQMEGNPLAEGRKKRYLEEEKKNAKEMEMEVDDVA